MYKQDFVIIKGDTFVTEIDYTVNNTIYPLNEFTAKSEIRPYIGSKKLTESFTCEVLGDEGIIKLSLTSQQTNNLPKGKQYYDVVLINTETNEPFYFMGGKIFIKNHVTELQ